MQVVCDEKFHLRTAGLWWFLWQNVVNKWHYIFFNESLGAILTT